jgi:DNA polymerase-1
MNTYFIIVDGPLSSSDDAELSKILHEAGILKSDCVVHPLLKRPGIRAESLVYTNKKGQPLNYLPFHDIFIAPELSEALDNLAKQLVATSPSIVIPLNNTSLRALTDNGSTSISTWRGSQLQTASFRVLPTYPPGMIQRQWDLRAIAVLDFTRARNWVEGRAEPTDWRFLVRPSFNDTMQTLDNLLSRTAKAETLLSVDLETRAGHIACCGIAWSESEAISIPFMAVESPEGYFSADEELAVILKLRDLLTHKNARVVGQNFAFDSQYIQRYWHFIPRLSDDTLIAQGLLWPGLPKALDFLSSMYCRHHLYWKDDGKFWDPRTTPEEQLWTYNCVDACRTYEIILSQTEAISKIGLVNQYQFLLKLWYAVLGMMIRGVLIDKPNRGKMTLELMSALASREQWFIDVLGHPLNPRSSKQMKELFYDDLRAPMQKNRKTGQPSLDDKALEKIQQKNLLLKPLVKTIQDFRSIGVFLSTFVQAPLDVDDKMRCSYNIVGTETFRFNSSENPFGSGTNLQNVPKGNEKPKPGELAMPNIRKLFIPPPGHLICDADLDRADLQVVVWEANDLELKQMLREGIDLHSENAKALGISRQLAKAWVHGTNYGGGARTMAINCGITVHQAEKMRARWFQIHPGIKEWHDRTLHSLETTRSVRNPFGFRRFYFDRIEGLLPEALAWQPQSTVANIINLGLLRVAYHLPDVEILLQVHDSLVFQLPEAKAGDLLPKVRDLLQITVPYPDPLTIPVGLKASKESWGAVEDRSWQ